MSTAPFCLDVFMTRLLGALVLVAPSLMFAVSLKTQLQDHPDPWARRCEEKSAASRRDELDYGPCFDEEEVETAMRTSLFIGRTAVPASDFAIHGQPPHSNFGANFSATAPNSTKSTPSASDSKQKAPTSIFTEVDMLCDTVPRPLSDSDERLGAGNPVCRYEPSEVVLQHYSENPEDIAIVIPSNYQKDSNVSDNPGDHDPLFLGVLAWKMYARFHGYGFYSGPPENSCPELKERHPAWTKPCMAMDLIKKHEYLIIVDRDTTVIKPRLRLEPLFNVAGLMDKGGKKILAVAEEWGSCKKGVRSPLSGDVNTGIVLLRRSPATTEALASWFYGPTWCKNVATAPVQRPVWWPFHTEPCQGCSCITQGVDNWSYDQVGFYASVANNESFRSMVTVFRSGCPINSPFADFIPHLVSGTPTKATYDVNHRAVVSKNLHACISDLLNTGQGKGNPYARCSICDALPELSWSGSGSWSLSCRSHSPVPSSRVSNRGSFGEDCSVPPYCASMAS